MTDQTSDAPCPCGSGDGYGACCGLRHSGVVPARTAEQLMRSRYSAFHRGIFDYLLATRHRSKRSVEEARDLPRMHSESQWTGLRIVDVTGGSPLDERGEVEFIASYQDRETGAPGTLHERSRFVKEGGRWFYVDGDRREERDGNRKLGRNDPCWCGSGKKLKKCHGDPRSASRNAPHA